MYNFHKELAIKNKRFKESDIKWHRDIFYLLEILYTETSLLNNDELRNLILYNAFNEAVEELEKYPAFYFEDPKFNPDRSLLNIENKPAFLPGETIKESEVFDFLNSSSGFIKRVIMMVEKICFKEHNKEKNDLLERMYPIAMEYREMKNRAKKPRLKPDDIRLISYKNVIDMYNKNKKISERNACKRIFNELEKDFEEYKNMDFQSFLVSFRTWYSNNENQKKYEEIKTFLEEKAKRKKKKV